MINDFIQLTDEQIDLFNEAKNARLQTIISFIYGDKNGIYYQRHIPLLNQMQKRILN